MLCSTSLTVKTNFLQLVIQNALSDVTPGQAHTSENVFKETDLCSSWVCTPVILQKHTLFVTTVRN